jgi:hypothetical protein
MQDKVEKLQEQDRMTLELAKMNKKMMTLAAEKAIAQNETADLQYKYVVLQLYVRYGLTANDGIDENGNIIRGGEPSEIKNEGK